MMAIVLLSVLFVAVESNQNFSLRYDIYDWYTQYGSWENFNPEIKQVVCSVEAQTSFNGEVTDAECGDPKEVYVELRPPTLYEKVTPIGALVKRCVGICDYYEQPSKCRALTTSTKSYAVRIYSAKSKKSRCATYDLVEHTSCGCSDPSGNSAARSAVYMPPDVPDYEPEYIVMNELENW